jgi:hypothetical protein
MSIFKRIVFVSVSPNFDSTSFHRPHFSLTRVEIPWWFLWRYHLFIFPFYDFQIELICFGNFSVLLLETVPQVFDLFGPFDLFLSFCLTHKNVLGKSCLLISFTTNAFPGKSSLQELISFSSSKWNELSTHLLCLYNDRWLCSHSKFKTHKSQKNSFRLNCLSIFGLSFRFCVGIWQLLCEYYGWWTRS